MKVDIDRTRWPTVLYIFPEGADEEVFAAFLVEARALLDRKERHAMVMDLSQIKQATARQRKMAADFNADNEETLRQYRVGSAFVVRSALVRGVLTAIFWMRRPPYEYTVTSVREDALKWCELQLKKEGPR